MARIFVLNPNNSVGVTADMAGAVAPLAERSGHRIDVDRLPDAPDGIESDADVAAVGPMVAARLSAETCEAAVIGCFSDPGIAEARRAGRIPVIGIAEAAYYAALQLSPAFGVISLSDGSVRRHAAHIDRLGLAARLAGDLPVSLGVANAADPAIALDRIAGAGAKLRDEAGAGALILGCAGMGKHRPALQSTLGLPVIDPVEAAVAAAITIVDLGYPARKE